MVWSEINPFDFKKLMHHGVTSIIDGNLISDKQCIEFNDNRS